MKTTEAPSPVLPASLDTASPAREQPAAELISAPQPAPLLEGDPAAPEPTVESGPSPAAVSTSVVIDQAAGGDDEPLPPPREPTVSQSFFTADGSHAANPDLDFSDLDSLAAAAVTIDPQRRILARKVVYWVMGSAAVLLVGSASVAALKDDPFADHRATTTGSAQSMLEAPWMRDTTARWLAPDTGLRPAPVTGFAPVDIDSARALQPAPVDTEAEAGDAEPTKPMTSEGPRTASYQAAGTGRQLTAKRPSKRTAEQGRAAKAKPKAKQP